MSVEHRLHARCAGAGLHAGASLGPRPFTMPGTSRVYERARPFALRAVALDLPARAVDGTATLDVERIDPSAREIELDAVAFEGVEVAVDAGQGFAAADHAYDGRVLRVPVSPADGRVRVRVRYRAVPRRGLYFLEPDEHVQGRPRQVWTQCQDEDARHFFPCHDRPHLKSTYEIRASVPEGWTTLSNGVLVASETEPGAGTWRATWRMDDPIPSYLVTLVAGEFSEVRDRDADGVPVSYLVPRGREEDARRSLGRTPDMIEHFGRLTGVRYPWNKYAQVVVSDFIFGGMENTTATTLYEHVLLDERAAIDVTSDDLVSHELAHQWFGDLVTCRDWSHGWLNEGFASFFEHVDREAKLGRDEYDYGLKADLDAYLGEARGRYVRPIVCQDYEAPIDVFDHHLYEKGACVLHMLRVLLGDATFWKGVGTYLQRHARSIVETRDLLRALDDVSGRGLDQFFDLWVHRSGHPQLEVKVEHDGGVLVLRVRQTQRTDGGVPVFAFDLPVDVVDRQGRVRRETRRVERADETIALGCADRPAFVVVDPEMAVLAEVRLDAPDDMLCAQLARAPTARGRWLAAPALGRRASPAAIAALGASLGDEKEFWGVRAEAAAALGEMGVREAQDALARAVAARHPKVRRAVAAAIGKFRTSEAAAALRPVALRDASYLVEAEAARALGATRQRDALDTLVEVLDRPSWADVVRAGALDGMGALRDDRALPHALARTRYGVATRGRRAAILALPRISTDRKVREALEDLLDDRDPYVRVDVVRALTDLGDARSRSALERQIDRDLDGRVRRRIREALREIGTSGRQALDALRDDLERVRKEQAELAGRVAHLESGRGNGRSGGRGKDDGGRVPARRKKDRGRRKG